MDIKLKYLNNFEKKIDNDIYSEPKSKLHYGVIEPQTQKFLDTFEIKEDKSVIDIGCGDGYFLSLLQKAGFKNLVGVTKHDEDIKNSSNYGLKDIRKTRRESLL